MYDSGRWRERDTEIKRVWLKYPSGVNACDIPAEYLLSEYDCHSDSLISDIVFEMMTNVKWTIKKISIGWNDQNVLNLKTNFSKLN